MEVELRGHHLDLAHGRQRLVVEDGGDAVARDGDLGQVVLALDLVPLYLRARAGCQRPAVTRASEDGDARTWQPLTTSSPARARAPLTAIVAPLASVLVWSVVPHTPGIVSAHKGPTTAAHTCPRWARRVVGHMSWIRIQAHGMTCAHAKQVWRAGSRARARHASRRRTAAAPEPEWPREGALAALARE